MNDGGLAVDVLGRSQLHLNNLGHDTQVTHNDASAGQRHRNSEEGQV